MNAFCARLPNSPRASQLSTTGLASVLGARGNLSGLYVCEPYPLFFEFFLDHPSRHLHRSRHGRHRYVLRYCQWCVSGYAWGSLDHGTLGLRGLGLEPYD